MDAHGLEPRERVSASKKLQRDEAREILSGSSRVIVAKGRSLERFDNPTEAEVLDLMLGTTGNLRAPLVRSAKTALVGFNEEAWTEALL